VGPTFGRAHVFNVRVDSPVLARARTSLPCKIAGIVECCTTVMLSKPKISFMDLEVGALRPSALKRPADRNEASIRGAEA
jgi:hypothetical protein